jgi:hypothetical protein
MNESLAPIADLFVLEAVAPRDGAERQRSSKNLV